MKKKGKNSVACRLVPAAPGLGPRGGCESSSRPGKGVRASVGLGQRWMSVLEIFPALTQVVVTPSTAGKKWGLSPPEPLPDVQSPFLPPSRLLGASSGVFHPVPPPLKCFSPFPLLSPQQRGTGPLNTHAHTHSHPPYSHLDALSSRSSSRGCTTAAGGSWVFRGRRISWRSG